MVATATAQTGGPVNSAGGVALRLDPHTGQQANFPITIPMNSTTLVRLTPEVPVYVEPYSTDGSLGCFVVYSNRHKQTFRQAEGSFVKSHSLASSMAAAVGTIKHVEFQNLEQPFYQHIKRKWREDPPRIGTLNVEGTELSSQRIPIALQLI